MPKTVTSPLQKKLATMLAEQRNKAGLRQVDLAKKMGVYQSWVTHMKSGQRQIDVIELIDSARQSDLTPRTWCGSCRGADCVAFSQFT